MMMLQLQWPARTQQDGDPMWLVTLQTSFQTDECNTVLAAPVAAEGLAKQPVKVAVGQMTAVGSTDQNFSTCTKLAQVSLEV